MEIKERIQCFIDSSKIYIDNSTHQPGGQQCGTIIYPTVIESEELDIKISVGYYRQNYKNREMAIDLFELALSEIIK